MKNLIFLFVLFFTFFYCNAQNIGTKKSFKKHKSELKSPSFFILLEKTKRPTKKDSTEIYIFNGFDGDFMQKCSFDLYKFKRRIYTNEDKRKFEYLDTISATHYKFQNQKIIYKEIWLKRNGGFGRVSEIIYDRDGQPTIMYSYQEKTKWYFDKKGKVIDKYDNAHDDNDAKKLVLVDNSKFTLEEHLKIRNDLIKIINNNKGALWSSNYNEYEIKDWKALNKTKEYFKNLFKTNIDLYFQGMDDSEIYFYSEYGDTYMLSLRWKELKEWQEKNNKNYIKIE